MGNYYQSKWVTYCRASVCLSVPPSVRD